MPQAVLAITLAASTAQLAGLALGLPFFRATASAIASAALADSGVAAASPIRATTVLQTTGWTSAVVRYSHFVRVDPGKYECQSAYKHQSSQT
jgi:hypothetical protein